MLGKNVWLYCYVIYISLVLAASLVVISGLITGWGEAYSSHLALRYQSEGLMEGRLALADSVGAVEHDQVWDNGNIQQVWGLGSGAWRVPFEAGTRLVSFVISGSGEAYFPDRIAFGVALTLVVFLAVVALMGSIRQKNLLCWIECLARERERTAALFILVLFPPFITLLCQGRFSVYSEVQAYSYLTGIGLLSGTLVFVRSPRLWMFLVIATFAGLTAFVRPTAGIYGLVTIMVLVIKTSELGWSWWKAGAGIILFIGGGLLLYVTNWIRFGAGFEFGHNLNLNNLYTMRFAGRFEAPYSSEPLLSAARELGSLLFFEDAYRSETFRWRQIYFPSYNVSYLIPLVVVVLWFVTRCRLMFRRRTVRSGEIEILALWCIGCTVPLFLFYLRFPFMNSRYLLDFAPGFAGGMLAFVYILRDLGVPRFGSWFRTVLLTGVVLWWGYQVIFVSEIGRGTVSGPPITREQMLVRMDRPPPEYGDMPEFYEVGTPPVNRVAQHNGSGWDSHSGDTRASIALFVEDPDFLELTVAPMRGVELPPEDYEVIRAKVALEFLELESMTPTEEGMILRFSGPERKRYQSGIQVVFIGLMTAEELHEGWSRFRLLRVRWREPSTDSKLQI